jgi:hypothetical protein
VRTGRCHIHKANGLAHDLARLSHRTGMAAHQRGLHLGGQRGQRVETAPTTARRFLGVAPVLPSSNAIDGAPSDSKRLGNLRGGEGAEGLSHGGAPGCAFQNHPPKDRPMSKIPSALLAELCVHLATVQEVRSLRWDALHQWLSVEAYVGPDEGPNTTVHVLLAREAAKALLLGLQQALAETEGGATTAQ